MKRKDPEPDEVDFTVPSHGAPPAKRFKPADVRSILRELTFIPHRI